MSEFSMRMDSLRREAEENPIGENQVFMARTIHDLTQTVERLSTKLDDFIETTSHHFSDVSLFLFYTITSGRIHPTKKEQNIIYVIRAQSHIYIKQMF